jgi:ribosomal protein S18 acetylase RimI-like enzyme
VEKADKTLKEPALVRCGEKEANYIRNKIIEHNLKYITEYEEYVLCLKDNCENIIGGIVASKDNERMTINYLWVDDSARGNDYGSKLIKDIEEIAINKECAVVWLNTFGFQAPDFYIKMGYELFGILENCINGYNQYFFKKILY